MAIDTLIRNSDSVPFQMDRNSPDIDWLEMQGSFPSLEVVKEGGASVAYVDLSVEGATEDLLHFHTTHMYCHEALGLSNGKDRPVRGGIAQAAYYAGLDLKREKQVLIGEPWAVQTILNTGRFSALLKRFMQKIGKIEETIVWKDAPEGVDVYTLEKYMSMFDNGNVKVLVDTQGDDKEVSKLLQSLGEDGSLILYGLSDSQIENSPLGKLDGEVWSSQVGFFFEMDSENFPVYSNLGKGRIRRFFSANGVESQRLSERDMYMLIDKKAQSGESVTFPVNGNSNWEFDKTPGGALVAEDLLMIKECYFKTFHPDGIGGFFDARSLASNVFDEEDLDMILNDPEVSVYTARNEKDDIVAFYLGYKDLSKHVNHYHIVDPNFEVDGFPVGNRDDVLFTITMGIHPDHQNILGQNGFLPFLRYVTSREDVGWFGGDVALTRGAGFMLNLYRGMGSTRQYYDSYNYYIWDPGR